MMTLKRSIVGAVWLLGWWSSWTIPTVRGVNTEVLIWATNGGGWRSMAIVMGFSNIFYQAGLITPTSSRFTSMSSNSGAAWFFTQFFYSPVVFNRTLVDNPNDLRDFVIQWMEAYGSMYGGPLDYKKCHFPSVILHDGVSVPDLFSCMFQVVGKDIGDPGMAKRRMGYDNRVPAMSTTNLYTQMSMGATARVNGGLGLVLDSLTYVGPSNTTTKKVYSVNLPLQYAVKSNYTAYKYGIEEQYLPLKTYSKRAPAVFCAADYNDYYLFPPPPNADIFVQKMPKYRFAGTLNEPFGGVPTMDQLSIASSITTAKFSGLNPSFLAQQYSTLIDDIENSNATRMQKRKQSRQLTTKFKTYYKFPRLNTLALCAQWPKKCKLNDGVLSDGGYSDGSTLAQHIGQLHTVDQIDRTKTLKVIQTFTAYITDTTTKFLSYFNTTFNQGIAPGDFLWAPGIDPGTMQSGPLRSMQIFKEYLDEDMLRAMKDPIPGTNLSTARLSLTTIYNPAVNVQAGQTVDMLAIFFYGAVPTFLIGGKAVKTWTNLTGETARSIAASTELLTRVQAYYS